MLVSVLLPAFQAAGTLDAALRSVGRQTERDWECVVVDDGSDDGTAEIAEAFAERDARFVVVRGGRCGLVPSLQAGLAVCRGRYVARMDADDLMHRRRLALQTEWLGRHAALAAVGARVHMFPDAAMGDGMQRYQAWLNGMAEGTTGGAHAVRRDAFVECPVAHPTLTVRAEILRAFGYREQGWPEDYDLVLRLLAAGHEVGVVPRRLLAWRRHGAQLSRTDARYGLDRFTACKAAFLAGGFLAAYEQYVLWGYGDTGRALCAALAIHGKTPAAIVEVHPGRLGQTIHAAPVVPVEALPAILEQRGARLPLVASVAGAPARALIRERLDRCGLRELRDFVVTA